MATQIQKRQIADGAIDDSKVTAGAGIQTSKLFDGAEFIKRNGSVPMTGNFDLGSNKIINVQTPTANSDGVNKGYADGLVSNLSTLYKYRNAKVVMTTNVVVSNPATAVFDGITLVTTDRILLTGQTAQAENGIYVFNGSAVALTRTVDADLWAEFPGCHVSINEGTSNADTRWFCTSNDGGTLGTTAIVYTKDITASLVAANFVDKEIPTGAINGVNTAFVMSNAPVSGSEHVYLNGLLQESGASNDYTITGANITFIVAPLTGEKVRVSYRK
jgi:hypothetical protein